MSTARGPGRSAALLAAAAFAVYNSNLRSVTSFDTYPTRYLPLSILGEGDLDLDEFPSLLRLPPSFTDPTFYHEIVLAPARGEVEGRKDSIPYYLMYGRGHFVSAYPVMTAILAVPVYALPVALGLARGTASVGGHSHLEIVATLLAKIAASAAVSASVAAIYLAVLHLSGARAALSIALLYAFATSSWSVSSQGLWQSSMSQPALALALYLLVRGRERAASAGWAGLPLALAVACRPPILVYALCLTVYVLRLHGRRAWPFGVAPVLVGSFVLAYNIYYFGHPAGGYAAVTKGGTELIESSAIEAVAGLLVSPSRGLLIYSPFLLAAIWGLGSALGREHRGGGPLGCARGRQAPALLTYVAVATLLTFAVYAKYKWWFGSFSYSYRYMVDLLPGLCLLLTLPWPRIVARPALRRAFAILVLWSVCLQVIGAFFFPCGWYERPVSPRVDHRRLWDFKDPEWLRCLCAGPAVPEGLRLLPGFSGAPRPDARTEGTR